MAQYLPYIPEVFPEPALYKPDLNFFDRMLQRKQNQFEQGLNQVKSAYNSVLNAPLSDKANVPLRDAYIKQAQENLKIMGSSDLSLPQNIQAAQGIFSPFWEDDFISKDASLTKWYQGEASKLASWRDSPDEKVRSKYNGIAMMYLNNGLSALQNANRSADAYSKIEKRQAVPFTNIEQFLQEQAKGQGLEIKYDDPNGAYLVETINGQRSQKKYSVWAQSLVGNNFYDQFRVTGIVEKEERAKAIKKSNPNLSEQEIGNIIAKDVVSELQQGYKKRTEEVDVELSRVNSLLTSVAQANNPANQNLFDNLISERANLIARKDAINEEYKNFDKDTKDRLFNTVVGNPDGYFATLAKQRLVENWATGRASIESKLIKENAAWTSAQNLNLRQKEYDLNTQKAIWDRDQDLWEREHPTAGKTNTTSAAKLKDAQGNDIEAPVLGQDKENSIMYRGFSGIDITRNQATALDLFNQLQSKDFSEAHSLIFDQQGILGLAKNLGLTQEEIAHVATAFQKEVASGNAHKFTKEQTAAVTKLEKALVANQGVKNAGITSLTGPETARNALIAYAQDYFAQRNNLSKDGNDVPLNNTEFEALMRYMTGVEKLSRYTANEKNREDLIQKNIVSNKEYASLVVDRGGKKDLITLSDLAKDMPTMELREKASNELRKFSKEDVARMYMSGKLSGTKMGELVIDGKVYIPEKLNDISGGFAGRNPIVAWNTMYADVLTSKYGESSAFSKLMEKANQSIVPNLLMYREQSGKQGTAWTLYFMPNKTMGQGDRAAQIVDQALNTANADIYDNGADPKQLDTKTMDAIRALLKSEKNMEEYIGAEYIPQGVNGKRTLRIVFSKPISEESKAAIGNVNLSSISGQTFNIVLKDGTTAPALDALPNSTGYQVYDMIARGKVFKSDPVIEASGFKFAITPNVITSEGTADEQPSYVTVDLEFNNRVNEKDPKSGQMLTTVKPQKISQVIQLTGSTAKSPDEIVEYLYGLYYQNMLDNRNRQQEFQNYIKTNQSGSRADFNEQLKALGLGYLIK
jgi:hypothetical protein